MRFFVGGYTADTGGHASGIGVLHAGDADDPLAGGQLSYAEAVPMDGSPAWITWHPTHPVLYAAMAGSGSVRAFVRSGAESFVPLGAGVVVGGGVCHVAAALDGQSLIASCEEGGRVVRIALDGRGALGSTTVGAPAEDLYAASGTHALAEETRAVIPEPPRERTAMESLVALLSTADGAPAAPAAPEGSRRSRAHQARFTPAGLVTTDIGFDQLRIWDTHDGRMRERQRVVLPRGTGPRHSVWHPSGHLYVVTEYSNEVFVVRPGADGTWTLVGGTPLLGAQLGVDLAAEIALSRDAQFVSVGVRGSNTMAILRVSGDGGSLRSVALVEAGVDGPRHHVIARDTMLVAGAGSHEIVSLAIDERTGVPGRVRRRVEAPSPACLLADATR